MRRLSISFSQIAAAAAAVAAAAVAVAVAAAAVAVVVVVVVVGGGGGGEMEKCNFSSFFSILFIRNGFAKLHWFGNTEIHPPCPNVGREFHVETLESGGGAAMAGHCKKGFLKESLVVLLMFFLP